MQPAAILAVVVSFEDAEALRRGVPALAAQVGHVHIVDNGSGPEVQQALATLTQQAGVTVSRFGDNRGIAAALNEGVRVAGEQGWRWVLTMDQDSLPEPGMTAAFCAYVAAHPDAACLTPAIAGIGGPAAPDGPVRYAITSGNLVRVDLLQRVGPFWEALFIDAVDFDFSLRVRSAGFQIHRVNGAKMCHRLGEGSTQSGGLRRFHTQHSPLRRYYIIRNALYLCQRHWRAHPGFLARMMLVQALSVLAIVIHGPERLASLGRMAQGIFDFALRRDGRFLPGGAGAEPRT